MRILVILFIMLWSVSGWAQVNAELFRGSMPYNGWGYTIGTDLRFTTGNVNLKSYAVDTRLDYSSPDEDFKSFVLGDVFKGSSNGQVFDDRGFFHARSMMNIMLAYRAELWGEVFAQSQYDVRKALNLRQLSGLGLRFQYSVFRFAWALGAGAMYEAERVKGASTTTSVWRSTNYLSLAYDRDFFKETTKAVAVMYYQPLYSDLSDYRIRVDLTAYTNFAVRWIEIGPNVTYAYDSNPPVGIQKQDLTLGLKLRLNLSIRGKSKHPRLQDARSDEPEPEANMKVQKEGGAE